jgi:hypothetical protein
LTRAPIYVTRSLAGIALERLGLLVVIVVVVVACRASCWREISAQKGRRWRNNPRHRRDLSEGAVGRVTLSIAGSIARRRRHYSYPVLLVFDKTNIMLFAHIFTNEGQIVVYW